jgi:hypothetical protein
VDPSGTTGVSSVAGNSVCVTGGSVATGACVPVDVGTGASVDACGEQLARTITTSETTTSILRIIPASFVFAYEFFHRWPIMDPTAVV